MKFIKKFESFISEATEAPTKPVVKPGTKPSKPAPKPQRPSPIRREEPAEKPDPKAKMKKATAEKVAETFIQGLHAKGELSKNYLK